MPVNPPPATETVKLEDMVRRYSDGASLAQIASRFQRSQLWVAAQLNQVGVPSGLLAPRAATIGR